MNQKQFFSPMSEDQVRAVPQFNELGESLSLDCPACASDAQLSIEGASKRQPRTDGYAGMEVQLAMRCICGARNTLRVYEHKGTVQLNWARPVQLTPRKAT